MQIWHAALLRSCWATFVCGVDEDYAPDYWHAEHVLYHLRRCEVREDILPKLERLGLAGDMVRLDEPLPSLEGLTQLRSLHLVHYYHESLP